MTHSTSTSQPAEPVAGTVPPPQVDRPDGTADRPDAPVAVPDGPAPAAAVPAPAGPPPAAARPRKQRDPFFDNAKYFAIALVAIGHSIAYLQNVPLAKGLYLFIYMFHMPVFIVLTGYMSRNWTFSGGKARRLITVVGVPYVVFEVAYSLYDWVGTGRGRLEISLLEPYYLTWFLLALFMWRLSTPVWQQVRWPVALSLVISLLSYTGELGSTLSLHRVLGLLPFYVLGLTLRPEHFEVLKRPIARPIGAAVLLGGLGFAYLAMDRMNIDWIFWRHTHEELGVSNVTGTLMRVAMFGAAFVLVAAFLAVVPRGRHWFTGLGAATLYGYLLHGFLTRAMNFTDGWDIGWINTEPGVLAVVAIAAVVVTLLCTPPVVRVMRWALEPKMPWMFIPLRRPAKK
ncbi:acyltransferase family protein [Actinomadura algeriensis]|uniref:Fucose 4-O-acetylase-like acetyltransferase n=1 Tax=Actinomadura algeriensis TaxID=1679523 RepID=A0ABR9JT95_9ACTN|nr:acyltransferase family protein [Actinomadura algeriensis]MBE1533792.1 fucose 4-O-acetylase-like acetyltransferase [Actinomadura algeriensis]